MGQKPSGLAACINDVCDGRSSCMGTRQDILYDAVWAKRRNLDIPGVSDVTFRPMNAEDVAAAVKCAVENKVPVQALGGGHSYGYV
jgi:FAD/FMN-containing dehydrogenase